MKRRMLNYKVFIYAFFFLFSLCFILPFLLLIGISFSTETDLINTGFKLIPEHFTLEAYKMLFENPDSLMQATVVTLFYAFVPTACCILVEACCGYALARQNFVYKKYVKAVLIVTMFVNGGIVPAYILRTQYLGLQDNLMTYFWCWGVGATQIFIFRTFFQQLPADLYDSAHLDGASEFETLVRIIAPLSKPVLATYFLLGMLNKWNDYTTTLYYITSKDLYTLQYLMQKILQEAEAIRQMISQMGIEMANPPTETLKFAICVFAAIPMMVIFPFFQKFFSKGITVGSVKG